MGSEAFHAFWKNLFSGEDFLPYGHLWAPEVVWLHVLSDACIAVAFFSIPCAIVYFALKRRDFAYNWLAYLFGIFILACGVTHLVSVVTLWHPFYRFEGLMKAGAAVASVAAAFLLLRTLPGILSLPSHRQLAELNARLQEREDRLRSILDNTTSLVFLKSLEGRFLLVNPKFEEAFGRSAGEIVGKFDHELLAPEFAETCRENDRRVAASGRPMEFEERADVNGEVRTFLSNKFLIRNAAGEAYALGAISSDITGRKRQEEKVSLLAAIVDSTNEGIVCNGLDGTILSWNGGAERIFGYGAPEAVGRSIAFLEPPERAGEGDEILRLMRGGESIHRRETTRLRKDGRRIDVSVTFSPMRKPTGEVFGFSSIVRDISEEKAREREIRQLNEALVVRTRELEEANSQLESFSYSVSHDLRAPLRAIEGFSGILEEGCASRLGPEGSRLLGIVRKNARRMEQLIDDLLVFARCGRGELAKEPLDMNALADNVVRELDREASLRGATVRIRPLEDAAGDRSLLRQVLHNLVANALKFSSRRPSPSVEVGSYSRDGETIYYVKDNGVGFDPKYRDKLFHVFQRLHGAQEFEGTGVGLAIVQRIVQRHGGKVWAEGAEGQGATFFFSLPRRREAA